MSNLRNSVQLIGRLGKDPEVKTFESGKRLATITLATNENYKNHKGEKVSDTQWHSLVIWGKLVDIVAKYLKKGSEIAIEGKLVHRSYETSGGDKKYVTEITVNDLVMLGGKSQS
jgi:single-strand DNA-binding protein